MKAISENPNKVLQTPWKTSTVYFSQAVLFKLLLTFKLLYYFDKIKLHFLHYKVHFSFWKQAENHIPNVVLSEITTFKKFFKNTLFAGFF